MNRKLVIAVLTVLVVIGLAIKFKSIWGIEVEMNHSRAGKAAEHTVRQPVGIVCAVDPVLQRKIDNKCVEIRAYNEMYASIGVTRHSFEQWEGKNGFIGIVNGSSPAVLAPAYPILSKVAWMYIDPVVLTSAETGALIEECRRAVNGSTTTPATEELTAIAGLAEFAQSKSALIRFGHP